MNDEEFNRLVGEKDDAFSFLKETRKDIWDKNFDLGLAQFDLLKSLSSMIMGLAAIGYLYDQGKTDIRLDQNFLVLGFFAGLFCLLFSISWTKENIDELLEWNAKTMKDVEKKSQERIQKVLDSIEIKDINTYYDYVKEEHRKITVKIERLKDSIDYMGKMVVFLFYSSLGFVIAAFFPNMYCSLKLASILLIFVISFSLSHCKWTTYINKTLNRIFNK